MAEKEECVELDNKKRLFSALGTSILQIFIILLLIMVYEFTGVLMITIVWTNPIFGLYSVITTYFCIIAVSFMITNLGFEFTIRAKRDALRSLIYGFVEGLITIGVLYIILLLLSNIIIIGFTNIVLYYITVAVVSMITNMMFDYFGV
jgi:hypothetical protein